MPYDETLSIRIRGLLAGESGLKEKKMFGGVAWMVDGNMACGVIQNDLIIRLDPAEYDQALKLPFVGVFNMTGKPMRGWVRIHSSGIHETEDLEKWVQKGKEFAHTLPPK